MVENVEPKTTSRSKPRNLSKYTRSNISTTSSDSEHYPITSKLLNNSRSATLPRPPRNIRKQVQKRTLKLILEILSPTSRVLNYFQHKIKMKNLLQSSGKFLMLTKCNCCNTIIAPLLPVLQPQTIPPVPIITACPDLVGDIQMIPDGGGVGR